MIAWSHSTHLACYTGSDTFSADEQNLGDGRLAVLNAEAPIAYIIQVFTEIVFVACSDHSG